jgi:hypothetical protein
MIKPVTTSSNRAAIRHSVTILVVVEGVKDYDDDDAVVYGLLYGEHIHPGHISPLIPTTTLTHSI